MSLGNLGNCIDQYAVVKDLAFNCSFGNYALLSCEYFLLMNVNFVVSHKFYCASKDLEEFALHKTLPSENKKRIQRRAYITIWAFSLGYFLFYIIFGGVLILKDRFDSFLSLNFACLVVLTVFLMAHAILFSLSFRQIRRVSKVTASKKNSNSMKMAERISGSIVICSTLFCTSQVVYVLFQGLYSMGDRAIIVTICVTYFIMQINQFLIVSCLNMDFTLATKVHADGHLLIAGINERGNEIFKLYMNNVDEQGQTESTSA